MELIIGAITTLVLGVILAIAIREANKAAQNMEWLHFIIRKPKTIMWLGIICALFFGALIALMIVFPNDTVEWRIYLIFGAFAFIGISLAAHCALWKVEIDGNELRHSSLLKRTRVFTFDNIKKFEIKGQNTPYENVVLYSEGKKLLSVEKNCRGYDMLIARLRQQAFENNSFNDLWETDFDDIWDIDIKNNLLIALNGWLCKISGYGEYIEFLSHAERTAFFILQLEGEVNNGGFSQFFYSGSGDFANETPAALREIGANRMAEICAKALAALGGTVPKNRDEREIFLDNTFTDEIGEILNQCDMDFYEYRDDLVELLYRFVFNNRTQFNR